MRARAFSSLDLQEIIEMQAASARHIFIVLFIVVRVRLLYFCLFFFLCNFVSKFLFMEDSLSVVPVPQSRLERFNASLDFLIEHRKLFNMADLARVLGKQKSYVSEVLSSKRGITDAFLEEYCSAFPELSFQWLSSGEGNMLLPPSVTDEYYREYIAFLEKQIQTKDWQIEQLIACISKLKESI